MDFIDENDTEHNDIEHFLFYKHFKSLPLRCREILSLYLQGLPIHKITTRLQLSNDKATIDKKYHCKEKLKDLYSPQTYSPSAGGFFILRRIAA